MHTKWKIIKDVKLNRILVVEPDPENEDMRWVCVDVSPEDWSYMLAHPTIEYDGEEKEPAQEPTV